MPEQRPGFRVRDPSPDSVIFALESNFSLFSSASASVDRCSFDRDDSTASEISPQNSAPHDRRHEGSSSGPDRDPDPNRIHAFQHTRRLSAKGEKAKVQKKDSDSDLVLDSARSSFSLALKECQDRRSRSEALSKKLDRPRPASLDLNNNASVSSPRLGAIKKDEKFDGRDGVKDAATNVSRAVSRRDMATQMSPDSAHSSPRAWASFSASTSSGLPIMEVQSVASSKSEVRDVQVDERVTVTRWSKKHKSRRPGKGSHFGDSWKKKDADVRSAAWDLSDTSKSISKGDREEAKITAWENLQKAKAEAAIRKLEMKLEKKRSSSMDKIMNKLRSAQKKAQDMRSSVLDDQAQVARTSRKALSFRRTRHMSSLSGCFTCHVF
ncbi:hypothetical protein C1H46_027490 [Malus baccata]|uniref:Remorin C-terminal domain-containing protein n=1 Tax=Malus baccata TaxID=106549 RepID=A0A540LKI0_MALBA|nr:hypothetical protein C1H46_027490 [Malus baccata]